MSDEVWQTVQNASTVRPARVRAARARLVAGEWPSGAQVADVLLAGWFRRLMVQP